MSQPEVDILLSTFNGERFIVEQLESILSQSFVRWRILIRDDGSTDQTRVICETYARRFSDRITVLEDGAGNLGVTKSFGQLLGRSSAPYIMFCDQDDVWLPDKIAFQLNEIKALESVQGSQQPLAVFTDALVVDAALRPIAGSLLRYINREGDRGRALNRLCVEANCYGCTMILNRALVERVGHMPDGVISHDWWCGLVAATFGALTFVDSAPIKHRRHATNVSATKKNSWIRYLRERPSLFKHRDWIQRVFTQCEVFAQTYSGQYQGKPQRLFTDLARLRQSNWIARRWLLLRHRVRTTGTGRNIGFFLAV